jgi:hypothetical protein
MLSNVTAKRRKSWLLAASALASSSLGISAPALAQCSPPPPNAPTATCTGTFNDNINYIGANPLTLTGVTVNSPGGLAVGVASAGGASDAISIVADGVTINNTAGSGVNLGNIGLGIVAALGGATITTNNTTIDVTGTSGDWAINAHILHDPNGPIPRDVLVDYKQGTGLGLSSGQAGHPGGNEEGGIHANNHGTGNATILATGNINVVNGGPNFAYGMLAHAGETDQGAHAAGAGNASIHYSGGTINVNQDANAAPGGLPGPRGILAWIDGKGSASVTTDVGTTIKVSGTPFGGPAVFLFSSDPTAHTNTLTANVASTIESVGPASVGPAPGNGTRPVGIRANNSGS